jgi:hypothetical protein
MARLGVSVSVAGPVSGLYLTLPAVLGVLLLGEPLTLSKVVGLLLAMAAIYLLGSEDDEESGESAGDPDDAQHSPGGKHTHTHTHARTHTLMQRALSARVGAHCVRSSRRQGRGDGAGRGRRKGRSDGGGARGGVIVGRGCWRAQTGQGRRRTP